MLEIEIKMASSSSSADELQAHLKEITDSVDRVVVEGSRAHNQATRAAETAANAVAAEAESSGSSNVFKVPVRIFLIFRQIAIITYNLLCNNLGCGHHQVEQC